MPLVWTNPGDAYAMLKKRQKHIEDVPKLMRQMGFIAKQTIQNQNPGPMHVASGNWQKSWKYAVTQVSSFVWEVKAYSPGAFADDGYNYGRLQEDLHHPGEIGWHKAEPKLMDMFNKFFKDQETVSGEGMSDFANLDVGSW